MTGDPPRDDDDANAAKTDQPARTERKPTPAVNPTAPAIRASRVTPAPRASVPAPAARPWSRPPPPRDDTATTEWASADHAGDSIRTTEHRAAREPDTEKIGREELEAVRPAKPRRIERRDRVPGVDDDKWIPSDELPTTQMDSPHEMMAEAKSEHASKGGAAGDRNLRETKQIRSLFWVFVFAIVIAIAVLAGLHVFARH